MAIERRSRWFPRDNTKWPSSTETALLFQDFHSRVVPYRHEPEAYELATTGVDSFIVDDCLTIGRQGWRIDGFVRTVASRLLTDHTVWIEVVPDTDPNVRQPFKVFDVEGVRRTRSGRLVQLVPGLSELPESFRPHGQWEESVELDDRYMVQVTLPERYRSAMLERMAFRLSEIRSAVVPDWVVEQLTVEGSKSPGFDLSEVDRFQRMAVAQAALPIGWTAREIFRSTTRVTSDYYHYWRELRFLHFVASMRIEAERGLRSVLEIASRSCSFRGSVHSVGLPTPTDIEKYIVQFERGELAFSSVNEILFQDALNSGRFDRRAVWDSP